MQIHHHFRKNVLSKILLIFLGVFLGVFLIEVSLRVHPALMGRQFENGILTKYRTGPGGIYYYGKTCEGVNIRLMKPDFKTQMFYNGYTWTHETDHLGFRNPAEHIPADILLVGDSFIYGHGVNFDKTVGYALEDLSGIDVYNLARQADTIFQQKFLLSQYIDIISPKYVIYFYFNNDISDLYFMLGGNGMSNIEIEEYFNSTVQQPVEVKAPCEWKIKTSPPEFDDYEPSFYQRLTAKPYLLRIPDFYAQRNKRNHAMKKLKSIVNDEASSAWSYMKHSILSMDAIVKEHGAELIIVPITPLGGQHQEILRSFSEKNGLPFVHTYQTFNRQDHAEYFLPGDGHFSEYGARHMAEMLVEYLKQPRSNEAPPGGG